MEILCSKCNVPMSRHPEHGCWCAEFPDELPVPDKTTQGASKPRIHQEQARSALIPTMPVELERTRRTNLRSTALVRQHRVGPRPWSRGRKD